MLSPTQRRVALRQYRSIRQTMNRDGGALQLLFFDHRPDADVLEAYDADAQRASDLMVLHTTEVELADGGTVTALVLDLPAATRALQDLANRGLQIAIAERKPTK